MSNAQHKRMTTCYDEPEWTVITSDRQPPIMVLSSYHLLGTQPMSYLSNLSNSGRNIYKEVDYLGESIKFTAS